MPHSPALPRISLALLAAAAGGAVGYYAFFWIAQQGFYAIMLPPALVGLAAGYVMTSRSQPLAIVCCIAGLALGLFTEWKFAPFRLDNSWSYFLTHVHQLKPVTLLMLVIGAVASYRFALGRDRGTDEV